MAGVLKHTHSEKFKKTIQGVTISVSMEAPESTNLDGLMGKAEELFSYAEKTLDPDHNPNQTELLDKKKK